MFSALLLTHSIGAFVVQMAGIGSAAMLYLTAMPLFVSLALERAVRGGSSPVSLWTYALGQLTPLLTGTQVICTTVDIQLFHALGASGCFYTAHPLFSHLTDTHTHTHTHTALWGHRQDVSGSRPQLNPSSQCSSPCAGHTYSRSWSHSHTDMVPRGSHRRCFSLLHSRLLRHGVHRARAV